VNIEQLNNESMNNQLSIVMQLNNQPTISH